MRRLAFLIGSVTLLLLAALVLRMSLGSFRELNNASAADANRDVDGEIRSLRRSIAYYFPGNPWVRQAHHALIVAAHRLESEGKSQKALDALYQHRTALLSLRSFYQPFADALPTINEAIARLTSTDSRAPARLRTPQARERFLSRLQNPPRPNRLYSAMALVGFFGWVGSAFALFFLGLRPPTPDGRTRWLRWATLILCSLILFFLGLRFA